MRTISLVVLFVFVAPAALATDVSGLLSTSATWTPAGNPYRVTSNLEVASGATLTIDPGVVVQLTSNVSIKVSGGVAVRGTSSNAVQFRPDGANVRFGTALEVLSTATSCAVAWAQVEGEGQGFHFGAPCSVADTTVRVTGAAVRVSDVAVTLTRLWLRDSTWGVYASGDRAVVDLSRSVVSGIATAGVKLDGNCRGVFDHNTIVGNSSGIWSLATTSAATVTVTNNIIVNNFQNGLMGQNAGWALHHNNVWGNAGQNLPTGVATGAGAMSADPLFVSATDYHLQATSRCRGAASDGTDLGAYASTGSAIVDRIEVLPATANVPANGTVTFTARALDSSGAVLPGVGVAWAAPATAGTVQNGALTAGCALGFVPNAVSASAGGKTGFASVTIVEGPVASVVVTPQNPSLEANATQSFTATASDSCGHPVSGSVSWRVPSSRGSITSAGLYTAPCSPGTYSGAVEATSGGVSGSTQVTVTAGSLRTLRVLPPDPAVPAAGQQQFSVAAADGCGNPLQPAVSWAVNGGAGTITQQGTFTASASPGHYPSAVEARAGALSARTSVTVANGSVHAVTVTPASVRLAPQDSQRFLVEARDGSGNLVSQAASWRVSGGGFVDASGLLTAGTTAGSFVVTATVAGVSGTAAVVVEPGPANRVAVSPASATLGPQGVTTFSAQVFDGHGNLRADPVVWSVLSPAAGTITPAGAFTASTSPGSYPGAVRATAGTVSQTADVKVEPGALLRLELSPSSAMLRAGESITFSVLARDAAGNPAPVVPQWSALRGGTIDGQGRFVAGANPGIFVDAVQAVAGGIAVTANVVVTPGPPIRVLVLPAHPVVVASSQQQFQAKAFDAFGNELPGLAFSWQADGQAGSIDPSTGLFTSGGEPGDFSSAVTAATQGVSGSASVLVLGREATPDAGTALTENKEASPDGSSVSARAGCGCGGGSTAILPLLGLLWAQRRRGPRARSN